MSAYDMTFSDAIYGKAPRYVSRERLATMLDHEYRLLKERLAERAAQLVDDGETVFIEGGSANALLARHLALNKRVTIITISSYIAHLLKDTPAQVVLLGGLFQHQSESVVGPLTLAHLIALSLVVAGLTMILRDLQSGKAR